MFRCQHSLLPESCLHYCRINPQQSYYMRQTHYFATESFRTTIREQCINIQGPKIWDSLPVPLLAVTNLVMLKHNVLRYMIASYWVFFSLFFCFSHHFGLSMWQPFISFEFVELLFFMYVYNLCWIAVLFYSFHNCCLSQWNVLIFWILCYIAIN